jgi:glycosyltransferase involved in cell wall biosynthesis
MKIAINAIPYTRWSGIEIFLFNILKHWPNNQLDEVVVFVNKESKKLFSSLPSHIKIREIKIKKINRLNLFLFQQINLPFILKKEKFDVIFCASLITPWLFKNKIITIHDAAPFVLKNENSFLGKVFWRINLFFSLIANLKIITVSKFSKEELVKKLKIKKDKIEIIYNGTPIIDNDIKIQDNNERYILAIGNARPRKNLETLFLAFKEISLKETNSKLKIIGKMDSKMLALKDKYGSNNIIFTGFIEDNEKYQLIKNSLALIFPSLYEGFGIPILEAGALQTPVICSNIPAFREIAEKGSIFFSPKDSHELADKIKILIKDEKIRNNLGKEGLENSKKFNWKNSAQKLFTIIHQYETPTNQ